MKPLYIGLVAVGVAVAAKVGFTWWEIQSSRSGRFERGKAVVRLCEGASDGVDGPEASADRQIRYLEKRNGAWQDDRGAWPDYAHPDFVVCEENREEVLETGEYRDADSGRMTTLKRVRRHLKLRVVDVRSGEELLAKELHGEEPPPFAGTITNSAVTWGPKISRQEIDAVVRDAIRGR